MFDDIFIYLSTHTHLNGLINYPVSDYRTKVCERIPTRRRSRLPRVIYSILWSLCGPPRTTTTISQSINISTVVVTSVCVSIT